MKGEEGGLCVPLEDWEGFSPKGTGRSSGFLSDVVVVFKTLEYFQFQCIFRFALI